MDSDDFSKFVENLPSEYSEGTILSKNIIIQEIHKENLLSQYLKNQIIKSLKGMSDQ